MHKQNLKLNPPPQGQKTPIGYRGAGLSSMEYQLGYSARTRGALVPPSNNTIQMKVLISLVTLPYNSTILISIYFGLNFSKFYAAILEG